MDVKFGTSGLRGLASDLAAGPAAAHARAFAIYLIESGQAAPGAEIFFGRDKRQSSPAIYRQCAGAVADCGLKPVDCGEIATPALAFHAFANRSAAIMITGSHIPANRNGIKFYLPGGEISKADEAEIAARARISVPDKGTKWQARDDFEAATARFAKRHLGLLKPGELTGLRVGVCEHSSVATPFLADLLASAGAQVVPFGRTDEFTPVDTEAVAQSMRESFATMAKARRMDAIISTDADGDRPLVADETGTPLPGDLIAFLACRWLGITAVATPVSSNSAIDAHKEIHVRRTKIGSPYVIAAMAELADQQAGAVAGFEANGGFLLQSRAAINGVALDPLPTRDSTLPILATLLRIKRSGAKASKLGAMENFRATTSDRLQDYPATRSTALLRRLASDNQFRDEFIGSFGKIVATDETDGLRYNLAGGKILHLRASGNAPELRCYTEAADSGQAQELLAAGLAAAARFTS